MLKTRILDPTEGPLLGKSIRYALPIAATGLLQLLFNAADLAVVGQFCGSNSVAAVGATGPLAGLLVNLFIGLSVGVGVSATHALGARNDEILHKTIHTAIPAAAVCGLLMMMAGILLSPAMLELMATPEEVIDLSALYMRIYFVGMPATMLCNFGIAILRAAGDTRSPLVYLTVSGVVNVGLNVIFVRMFRMDVAGVALATTLSGYLSAVLVLLTLMRRKDGCHFSPRAMGIYWPQLGKIFAIGIPAGIQSSLFAISNVLIQSSINSFGTAAISGNSAAASVEGFLSTALESFAQTAMNFTGLCVGAARKDRLNKILLNCLGGVLLVGVPATAVFWVLRESLLRIFITDSIQAVDYGLVRMGIMLIPIMIAQAMSIMSAMLRGMGRSLLPMAVTVVGVCVFRVVWIFTVFSIPRFHTFSCLIWSYPITWTLTFLVLLGCYISIRRKEK